MKKQIIEEARRRFNGQIKTKKDLFEHIERLQKCTKCNHVFWDKYCPDCVDKVATAKMIEKMLDSEIIAHYGKTIDERMAITHYVRDFVKYKLKGTK